MSPDINGKASFDHVVQNRYALDVCIDIADNQGGSLGLGRDFKQYGMKKLVRFGSIGRVLAATGMAV